VKAPKAPPAPNAANTIAMQTGANAKTAEQLQGANMVDQDSPIGSQTYSIIGTNPDGSPKYGMTRQYTPEQQALLDQLVGTKGTTGSAASNLADDAYSYLSEVPDFTSVAGSLTGQGIDRALPYMERMMAPQRAQLDTAMRNQGILPGTPAYQQQMDAMLAQQDLNKGNWMNSFQQQAFGQAKDQYTMPADMIGKLMGFGAPMDLSGSFGQTPTVNFSPPNAQQAVQTEYDANFKNYQQAVARQNMLMNLGLTGVAGIAGAPINPVNATYGSSVMKSIFG